MKALLALIGLHPCKTVADAYDKGLQDGRNDAFLEYDQEIGHERFEDGFAAGVIAERNERAAHVEALVAEIHGLKLRVNSVDPFGITKVLVG